ncbi:MAG: YncE family protein [Nitrospiraceae bacterium]
MNRRTVTRGIAAALLTCGVVAPAGAEETVTLFVTSMKTDTVNVFRGRVADLAFVRGIPVGREPHNLGISPDGRWAATGNRRSGEVSIIDTQSLKEVARIPVGRQPHDVAFSSDSRTLYVGHEQELYASVIEVGEWKRKRLEIGRAQHDLSISPDDKELWFTVTNRPYKSGDPRVGVVDLVTGKRVALIDTGANSHDVILSPDGRVAWVTNSGFIDIPDSRVDYLDVAARKVLGTIQLGKYPFHAPKRGRDGNYVSADAPEMWFTDHGLKAAHALSLADRRVMASVPVGTEPFHVTGTPAGILFVANHRSSTVTVIDGSSRVALGTLKVPPAPHGVAALVHSPSDRGGTEKVLGR